MNHNDIKELNTALKGEHMAIESFDHFIQDTKDENVKRHLMDMQQQHQFHAIQLSERIQQLGGNPVNTSGMPGIIAEVKHKISPNRYIDHSIIKTAIEGEEIGLQAYGDIFANLSDPANKKLTEEMIIDNVRIVEGLNELR